MIEHLSLGKTANFYARKARLTNKAVADLFSELRAQARAPSRNLFRHDRESIGNVRWSAMAFFHERNPAFLSKPPATKERVCGFMLLVEYDRYVAVFKAGLELPAAFKTRHLQRIAANKVESAIAHTDAVFEKIRLRNMSPSRLVLRSKTLEASDLQNAVGSAGANRFAPLSYSVRRADGHHSATPSTGRISQRSDKSSYRELIDWAARVMDELSEPIGEVAPFIRTFARPMDLASAAAALEPLSFVVNAASLAEAVFDSEDVRLVRKTEDGFEEIDAPDAAALIESLDTIFSIRNSKGELRIVARDTGAAVGKLAIGQNRITLSELDLPALAGVYVESTSLDAGEDPGRRTLKRYIDREDLFIVLFKDLALAYLDGALYRDDLLADGGGNFLKYLQTSPRLAASVSEKGEFAAEQAAFDENSVFGAVAGSIAAGDDILLCDDLSDEWADFIGLSTTSTPVMISFYHAKHGALSLGASPFHISVSQALKNLGRMSLPSDAIDKKILGWSKLYANNGVTTSIARVIRGAPDSLRARIEDVRTAPDVIRRAFIVTSSLSRRQVAETLADIQRGVAPDPHFVQLYWLLLSFFSACYEVGAFGYVICQE